MYAAASVVISRPWSRDSSALELILSRSRSRSRDLKKGIDNNTGNCPPHISSVFTLDENTLMAECARRLSSMSKLLAASGDFACSDSYLRILTTFFLHTCAVNCYLWRSHGRTFAHWTCLYFSLCLWPSCGS